MALGSEVDDGNRLVLCQQPAHQLLIANVALHEDMLRIVPHGKQVAKIAGIGQLVHVDHTSMHIMKPA